jgi:hypothetical protein
VPIFVVPLAATMAVGSVGGGCGSSSRSI